MDSHPKEVDGRTGSIEAGIRDELVIAGRPVHCAEVGAGCYGVTEATSFGRDQSHVLAVVEVPVREACLPAREFCARALLPSFVYSAVTAFRKR
jgi:hypothetical protein